MKTYEIIGPDEKVHYTRPERHSDLVEAENTPGYSVREKKWEVNPHYEKADGEVVLLSRDVPVGLCEGCRMPTNARINEFFVCSFCQQDNPDWQRESTQY